MDLKILCLVFRYLPVKRKKVFFSSFRGMYNDNPKSISEELYRQNKDIIQVWEKSSKSTERFPDHVKVVKSGSFSHYYHYSTAAVTIENGSGYFFVKWKSKFSFLYKYLKNPRSVDLATWHGFPLKHIGLDIDSGTIDFEHVYSSADYLISGSDYESKVFSRAFGGGIKLLKIGNPRNDVLFKEKHQDEIECVKARLGLPSNKKILLFCPTFRDNPEDSGLVQLKLMNIPFLLEAMEDKFGGDWCFVFRAHQKVLSVLGKEKKNSDIINGNLGDDMADYIIAADCIITDYSGIQFDWSFTDKPCFLYAHDLDNYKNVERGFYLLTEDLPFPFAETFSGLIDNITRYDKERSLQLRKEFIEKIGNYNDGHASEKAAKFILSLLNKRKLG